VRTDLGYEPILFGKVLDRYFSSMCVVRIREHVAGGAWCPAEPISKDSDEYLEVDLGRLMVITLVETQGRFDNGQVSTQAISLIRRLSEIILVNLLITQ